MKSDTDNPRILFRDDYCIVRKHKDTRVAIQTGRDPETATPTIVDGAELNVALSQFLRSEQSDG